MCLSRCLPLVPYTTLFRSLPALKDFILPGGGPAASVCHLARTIVRRAERRVWTLADSEPVNAEVPKYLNRLSDRKSTRLNSSHLVISYAVFCLKKKTYKN